MSDLLIELFIVVSGSVQLYGQIVPLLCALVQLSEHIVQLLLQCLQLSLVVAEILDCCISVTVFDSSLLRVSTFVRVVCSLCCAVLQAALFYTIIFGPYYTVQMYFTMISREKIESL